MVLVNLVGGLGPAIYILGTAFWDYHQNMGKMDALDEQEQLDRQQGTGSRQQADEVLKTVTNPMHDDNWKLEPEQEEQQEQEQSAELE